MLYKEILQNRRVAARNNQKEKDGTQCVDGVKKDEEAEKAAGLVKKTLAGFPVGNREAKSTRSFVVDSQKPEEKRKKRSGYF